MQDGKKAHTKRKKRRGSHLDDANKADEKAVPVIDDLEARESFLADMRKV